MTAPASGRIDLHHHALTADVAVMMREAELATPAVQWEMGPTLEVMDANGIQAAVISNVVPCDLLGDATAARRLARRVNEAAAEVVRARPDRFAFLATLPLPSVDHALKEAAYALDELGADGVTLLPHGGHQYLGSPWSEPLFAELARRHAVALVHPTDLPGGCVTDVPPVFADYLLDTTRAAVKLITSGTLQRHPEVPVILAHAGGFLPYAASRVQVTAELLTHADSDAVRSGIRRFHYDLALSVPSALPSLLAVADPGRIHFGTDWSGVPACVVERHTQALDESPLLDDRTREAINRNNTLRLLPGLAARLSTTTIPAGTR